MQELGKYNLIPNELNIIPNQLEKHMSFIVKNTLISIDSFQFLSSSVDSLVKNLSKDYFKHFLYPAYIGVFILELSEVLM